MACFLIPAAEAFITTIATKAIEKNEIKKAGIVSAGAFDGEIETSADSSAVPFSRKCKWLNNMLWGGSALLALEHIWHGEIVPWFPFFTAAGDPAAMNEVLHEMMTVGVTMSLTVTAAWVGMVLVTSHMEKKSRSNAVKD